MSELTKKRVHWKEYNGETLTHDEDVDILTSADSVTFSDDETLQYKFTQGQFVNPSTTGILSNLSTTNKSSLVDAVNEVKTNATSNASSISSLSTRMTTAESDIDSLETRMNTAESDINSLETRVTPISLGGTGATTASGALSNLGLTATASELNVLDGITATTTELNYVDGVTSAIQTQLNGKANASHTHDDRYYTETEIDTKLSEKVDNSDYTGQKIADKLSNPKAWAQSNITSGRFQSVCYGGNTWVVSGNGYGTEGLYYSTDGTTWAQSNVTTGVFNSVYYDGDKWFAASSSSDTKGLYYSTDGMTWTLATSGSFNFVYYGGDKWVAGGSAGIYYSTDGMTWTQSNITSGSFTFGHYGGDKWVTGGGSPTGLYYSTDGVSWAKSNITSGYFFSVYYGGDKWVAGGYNIGLYYSTDGMTWTQSNITSDRINSVYYGGNTWVAGRYSGSTGLYYSTDGMTWTQSNIETYEIQSVYYGDGIWVAGAGPYGSTGLYYSTDGVSWAKSNITSGYFFSVYYGGDKWVAGGSAGIYYSIPPYISFSDWNALLTMSSQYSATLADGTSNTTASVSDFIEDITNYVYIPIIISSSNGTPVTIQIDHTNKLAMITRGVGVSSTSEIKINYKILRIKIS